jgi:glycosyltransferase involved in cell wall biosynthesis
MRLAIGIATRARPDMVAEALREIAHQTRPPDRVLICGTGPEDVGGLAPVPNGEILFAPSGLPRQRNAILDRIGDCDVVLFLDDDFLMAPDYVAATVAALQADPEVVVTTGFVIADGTRGPGFSPEAGRDLIARDSTPIRDLGVEKAYHGYGCNMALRLAPVRGHALRFDERLPLYGWSEDVDFTHRLGRHGRIVKVLGARGVHLGVKTGRTPGRRLGYSQVANPIYLFGKGSYSWGRASRSVLRNLAANVVKSLQPEPYIDRRGRLHGNGLAILDLLRGRLAPERILDL